MIKVAYMSINYSGYPVRLNVLLSTIYRHHTNPVGTEWRWKMDDPDTIFQGALRNHQQLIKQFKGQLSAKCSYQIRPLAGFQM